MTVELWHISPTRKAVPDGQWSIWRNPVTDESGVIHPQITVANDRIAAVVRDALNALRGSRTSLAGRGPDAKVTRVEVIDHRDGGGPVGRVYSAWNATVELSYHDDGRTLKIFVTGPASQEGQKP